MARPDPKTDRMSGHPLFSGVPRRRLARLAAVVEEAEVGAGTVLARAGSAALDSYVVVAGEAEARVGDEAEALLGPTIGMAARRARLRHPATIVARTPMTVYVVPSPAFDAVLAAAPALATAAAGELARRRPRGPAARPPAATPGLPAA